MLKYGSALNTFVHTIGRRLFSRSGQQLYCLDKEWDGRCLLDVLADPGELAHPSSRYAFETSADFGQITSSSKRCSSFLISR